MLLPRRMLLAPKGGEIITVPTADAFDFAVWMVSTPATAVWQLFNNGNSAQTNNLSPPQWVSPAPPLGEYEVRGTVQSGTTPSGTIGSWVNLANPGSGISWVHSRSSLGTTTCDLLVEIRDGVSLSVLSSATISITVTVES